VGAIIMKHADMHDTGIGNVYMTIVTTILFFIARFALSDLAAIAAIFAGVTTGGYNIYRFIKDRKTKTP
jgi:hypothetical protein